ncbi:MAG: TonB-dependent receptor [Sediminicola sp.]
MSRKNYVLKSILFIWIFSCTTMMYGSDQKNIKETKVSIKLKNARLTDIFSELGAESGYLFSYGQYIIQKRNTYDAVYKNSPLDQILGQLSKEANFKYVVDGDNILVTGNDFQQTTVTGIITDEQGEPLPGASIVLKGTSNGVSSDFDGNYSIGAALPDAVLVFSYLGYKVQEIPVAGKATINVQLQPDMGQLDEVVVIGYGSMAKEKFNGAVSKIENESLNNYSTANFEQAISGNVAGIQVIENGKNPGDNSIIQIRGINTLTAGSEPLIVVDGIPLTEGSSFSSISNQDIESINILKDAASASIYGSRASNGVILITTKKGKKGKLAVTYDTYYGFQERIDNYRLVDAYDAAIFTLDSRNNGYVSGGDGRSIEDDNATRDANGGGKRSRIPTFLQDYLDGKPGLTNTDWGDAVYRSAGQQNHYLNLSGGTETTNYAVSFGYLDQDNIVIDSDFERFTNNIQINSEVNDRIRFGITSNTSLVNSNPTGKRASADHGTADGSQPDPGMGFYMMDPYYPVYNPDGTLAISAQLEDHNDNWDGPIAENVVASALMTDYFERRFRVFGNTYLELEPIDGLKVRTVFGGDYRTLFSEFFAPSTLGRYRTPIANNFAMANEINRRTENYISENFVTYLKSFGKHNLDVLLGYSYQQESNYLTMLQGSDFADDNLRNIAGSANVSVDVRRSKWALESYFSRLQYDYDNKYFLSAAIRKDGSSRFGANSRYADFISFSGGWTLSNEAFFPKNEVVDFAKLRASWGQTGNNQIDDFSSLSLIKESNYTIDGQLVSGSAIATAPNADLSWETNTSLNVGLDMGFFGNKIVLTAEYYNSRTEDLLLDVPVPQQSGYSSSLQNKGELENKGFELELKGNNYMVGGLKVGFNANFTTNQNKVLALGDGQERIIQSNGGIDFLTEVGGSIAQFYTYDVTGVFKTQEQLDDAVNGGVVPLSGTEVGDYVVRDANGDGRITPDDRVTQGDYNPEFTYGFGVSLTYGELDFSAQFTGVEGRKVADGMLSNSEAGEGFTIPTQYYFDNYYSPTRNPDGVLRSPDFSSFSSAGRATRASNLAVLDANYFRLRSLQMGYTFSGTVTDYLNINHLRLYLTGNNIFNTTSYRGLSAEGLDDRNNEGKTLSRGSIRTGSPITRFLALGLNVKF